MHDQDRLLPHEEKTDLRNSVSKPLKQFFVDFTFHFNDAPQCRNQGDVICRDKCICLDKQICISLVTCRHVIDELSEVEESFIVDPSEPEAEAAATSRTAMGGSQSVAARGGLLITRTATSFSV